MIVLLYLVVGVLALFFGVGLVRSLALRSRANPRYVRYQALHVTLWTAAIVSLSQCFATYRRLSGEQPNPHPVLNGLGGMMALSILVVAFLTLGFFMYREDRRNGKIKRKIRLYERFLESSNHELT